jgi:hypothetical protein
MAILLKFKSCLNEQAFD